MAKAVRFVRREVAIRRVEYVVVPPNPDVGESDYDRYEEERALAARAIHDESSGVPHDLRVIEGEEETWVTYETRRIVLREDQVEVGKRGAGERPPG